MSDFPTHLGDAAKAAKAVQAAEDEAAKFRKLSDDALVGLVGRDDSNIVREGVVVEMQRRLKVSIENFNRSSSKQTRWIIGLTIAIGVLTAAQVLLALWRR